MISLSLCMIVKNEEKTLARCLDSVRGIMDEIIIVDTGSTDQTKKIASAYTPYIYDFKWVDNFSSARNYSFSLATMDYIMWMDADDVLFPEDQKALKQLKTTLSPEINTVIMRYNLADPSNNAIVSSFFRERIVKRSKEYKWYEPVHEYLLYGYPIIKTEIAVTHLKMHPPTRRNLDIFEKYITAGNTLSERNWFYYAKELFLAGDYEKSAYYYDKFIDTDVGLSCNYMDSCFDLSYYYDLKKDDKNSLKSLLRFFEKDGPRAEVCCKLGSYYKKQGDYKKAISWYQLAPYTVKPDTMGSITLMFWDFVPYMELSVCYYNLGHLDKAIQYNEMASELRPDNEVVLHNRNFFQKLKQGN